MTNARKQRREVLIDKTRNPLRLALLGATLTLSSMLLASAGTALAQTYPDKPVRVIVAFAAGGLTDTMARTLQPKLAEYLGQPVVIENRGGAGGTLAEAVLAKSAPDGYTMMLSADSVPANPHLFKNLSYDAFRDLLPVTLVAQVPLTLIVHPSVTAASLQEFVTFARAKPVNYASPGTGTGNHLYMELFKGLANIDMQHVPYKGGGPAMADLIGGQVQALLVSVTLASSQVKNGKVRALGTAGHNRSPLLPQVPTFIESGYPNFTVSTWTGLFLPAGTPAPIAQRLHTEFGKAARSPEVEARFRELGAEVVMNPQPEFTSLLRSENERLGKLIRDRKISSD
jgi:tripartite-type tricarboxylate transporter receptor subunit TctC